MNDLKQTIKSILMNDDCQYDKKKLISARSILLAEQERRLEKNRDLNDSLTQIKRSLYYLSNIVLYRNINDAEKKSIIMWLKFYDKQQIRYHDVDNHVMLIFENNQLSFLNPLGIDDYFKKLILKDKEKYIDIAKYGIENHYNMDPIIPTISGDFKLYCFDDIFSIESNSDKVFKLYHLYDDNKDKGIETKDGKFYITTNVFNLKGMFVDKKGSNKNNVETFLNNLLFDEKDVPPYIKMKIKRI